MGARTQERARSILGQRIERDLLGRTDGEEGAELRAGYSIGIATELGKVTYYEGEESTWRSWWWSMIGSGDRGSRVAIVSLTSRIEFIRGGRLRRGLSENRQGDRATTKSAIGNAPGAVYAGPIFWN